MVWSILWGEGEGSQGLAVTRKGKATATAVVAAETDDAVAAVLSEQDNISSLKTTKVWHFRLVSTTEWLWQKVCLTHVCHFPVIWNAEGGQEGIFYQRISQTNLFCWCFALFRVIPLDPVEKPRERWETFLSSAQNDFSERGEKCMKLTKQHCTSPTFVWVSEFNEHLVKDNLPFVSLFM